MLRKAFPCNKKIISLVMEAQMPAPLLSMTPTTNADGIISGSHLDYQERPRLPDLPATVNPIIRL